MSLESDEIQGKTRPEVKAEARKKKFTKKKKLALGKKR